MNSAHLVNRIASDLYRVPGLRSEFRQDPASVLARYPLSESQRAALIEGSFASLAAAGMHPLVQMIYSVARHPEVDSQISVQGYFDELVGEGR